MSINISNDAIKALKTTADALGILNEGGRIALSLQDLQQKNNFEVVLYPGAISLDPMQLGTAVLDSAITKLYLQSIDINFNSLEFDNADTVKYVKSIVRPETITLHFIETELSLVRNYLQMWKNEVYYADPLSISYYVFRDNQEACKKNAIVTPMMGIGLPSLGAIKLEGLKPKEIEAISLDQGSSDPMIISQVCFVDKVDWMTPTNFLV